MEMKELTAQLARELIEWESLGRPQLPDKKMPGEVPPDDLRKRSCMKCTKAIICVVDTTMRKALVGPYWLKREAKGAVSIIIGQCCMQFEDEEEEGCD